MTDKTMYKSVMEKLMIKSISKIRKKFILISLIVAIAIGAAIVALAKYYATTNNKGVAVASGLYFSSNILTQIDGSTDINRVKNEAGIPTYLNPKVWSGATCTFAIEIKNNDSVLLFNDANLDIEYKVDFLLLENEGNTSYTVKQVSSDGNTSIERTLNLNNTVSFTGKIQGGQPLYDKYELSIHIENEGRFEGRSAPVLVVAYPTSPDYIAATADELRLVSIIQGDYTQPKIEIDTKGFLIENYMTDSNWLDVVRSYSGYEYNITTTGDIASTGIENVNQDIAITWNSNVLTIDKFNSYYMDAKNKNQITDNGDGTSTMIIDAMPYSAIKLTFYKKDIDYDFAALGSRQNFINLVDAEIIEN